MKFPDKPPKNVISSDFGAKKPHARKTATIIITMMTILKFAFPIIEFWI